MRLTKLPTFLRIEPEPIETKPKTYRYKGKDGRMCTVKLPAPSKHLFTITKGL